MATKPNLVVHVCTVTHMRFVSLFANSLRNYFNWTEYSSVTYDTHKSSVKEIIETIREVTALNVAWSALFILK